MKKTFVNLGSGTNIVPSTKEIKWLNIDKFITVNHVDFLLGDVLNIPLPEKSVDYIIMDQVLEHLQMKDIPTSLYEIRRVLKVGGRAVIIVPDFRSAVNQWLSIDHNKCFNPFYYHYLSEVIYGNQNHDGEFHRSAMSAGFLHYALNMVGLTKHEIVMHPENNAVPMFPGMNDSNKTAYLRNAQIVCDIIRS